MDRTVTARGFPQTARLRSPTEFKRVLVTGARIKSGSGRFDLKFVANPQGVARLGCIVPKRLTALAVCRNRLKRLMREAFRVCQKDLPLGDLVMRQIAKVADPFELALSREIEELFYRLIHGGHIS